MGGGNLTKEVVEMSLENIIIEICRVSRLGIPNPNPHLSTSGTGRFLQRRSALWLRSPVVARGSARNRQSGLGVFGHVARNLGGQTWTHARPVSCDGRRRL